MKLKQFLLIVAISSLSAFGSIWVYLNYIQQKPAVVLQSDGKVPANYADFVNGQNPVGENIDFIKASQTSVQAVVHIKTKIPAQKISNEFSR